MELVRHRLCSFAQESTRYCNYGKDEHITFIIPNWCDRISEVESRSLIKLNEFIPEVVDTFGSDRECVDMQFKWICIMIRNENYYNDLIRNGWQPQQARSVLPNSVKTEINVSTNIRDWRHIFKLRTAKVAHPQMRELMIPLLAEFKRLIPILFNDINPE